MRLPAKTECNRRLHLLKGHVCACGCNNKMFRAVGFFVCASVLPTCVCLLRAPSSRHFRPKEARLCQRMLRSAREFELPFARKVCAQDPFLMCKLGTMQIWSRFPAPLDEKHVDVCPQQVPWLRKELEICYRTWLAVLPQCEQRSRTSHLALAGLCGRQVFPARLPRQCVLRSQLGFLTCLRLEGYEVIACCQLQCLLRLVICDYTFPKSRTT